MCFVWWQADGYGPLWLYGSGEYRKSCERAGGKGVSKNETIMIRSQDPKRPEDPDVLKQIRLRDVKRSVCFRLVFRVGGGSVRVQGLIFPFRNQFFMLRNRFIMPRNRFVMLGEAWGGPKGHDLT